MPPWRCRFVMDHCRFAVVDHYRRRLNYMDRSPVMYRYSRPAGIQQPCHGINDFHSRVLFVFPGHQRSPAERQGKKSGDDYHFYCIVFHFLSLSLFLEFPGQFFLSSLYNTEIQIILFYEISKKRKFF